MPWLQVKKPLYVFVRSYYDRTTTTIVRTTTTIVRITIVPGSTIVVLPSTVVGSYDNTCTYHPTWYYLSPYPTLLAALVLLCTMGILIMYYGDSLLCTMGVLSDIITWLMTSTTLIVEQLPTGSNHGGYYDVTQTFIPVNYLISGSNSCLPLFFIKYSNNGLTSCL